MISSSPHNVDVPQNRSRHLLGRRVAVTDRARAAARVLVKAAGPHHLLLNWPGGVTALPAALHVPGDYSVIVGHVARCPVYADVRQLALFRDRQLVVDAPDAPAAPPSVRRSAGTARRPALRSTLAR